MTKHPQLTPDIHYLGVDDNETDLFESLWPLPEGISYNSYLIADKKTALIDAVDQDYLSALVKKISSIIKDKPLDYLVINHMEPDHSGSIRNLILKYPDLKIVGNHKTIGFLKGFYDIGPDRVKEIKNEQTLNLGKHQLQFFLIPMVHWPETMATYEQQTKILFSGDAFGGYKSIGSYVFADQVKDREKEQFITEARRYFSNIIGPYARPTLRAIKILKKLNLSSIAPAHGLIWKKDPEQIVQLYQDWAQHKPKPGVTIIYGSMYGHTKDMVQQLVLELENQSIKPIKLFDIARTHISFMLESIWQHQGLVLASSTYSNGLFPPVGCLLRALEERRLSNRVLGLIGNYSWTGGAMKEMEQFVELLKLEQAKPAIRAQYGADQEISKQIKKLGQDLAKRLT
ncbi:MAG: MBL fold metallo-hydrolase [Candidatus Pacebacteria bacterium]|nr:MBL fold metallo-hydrolase [Candidatus Paceibacterota bacterium]